MHKLSSVLTIGIGLLLAAVPGRADMASICNAASGNLVANCGFETGDFTGWKLRNNDGFTLVVGNQVTGDANSGGFYADLGTAFTTVTIQQTLADGPGAYTFSFAFASGGGGAFTAMWDNQVLLDLVNAPATPYTEYSFSVTGIGNDTISFVSRNDYNFDALDDVMVTPAAEASLTWLGALLGVAILFGIKRARS